MFNIVVLLFTGEQFLSPEDLLETGVFLGDEVRRQAEGGLLCTVDILLNGCFQK